MKQVLIILGLITVFISCKKENSIEFFAYKGNELNDTLWYNPVPGSARVRQIDSIFKLPSKIDSVNIATGGTISFAGADDSVSITFPPHFCSGPNVPTTGKVAIEVINLKQKGDMVKMARPTMSYGSLLVTGGALKIRATYNNQELQIAQGETVAIQLFNKFNSLKPSNDMKVFYGKEDGYPTTAIQQFTWLPSTDSASLAKVYLYPIQVSGGLVDTGYAFRITRFGWVNCDYFSDSSQPRTKAVVTMPLNFTNANTMVYAVLKSPDIVAQLKGDPGAKNFSISNIYVGKVVTFVSLSLINGNLYLGSKEVTITANMNISLNPVQMPKSQIDSFLDNL